MAKRKHLEYFRVKNFKVFKDLEINNLSTVNVITGDNNVGKTTLLEALLFDESKPVLIKQLHRTLCCRNLHIHSRSEGYIMGADLNVENYLDYFFNFQSEKKELEFTFKVEREGRRNLKLQSLEFEDLPEDFVKNYFETSPIKVKFPYWTKFIYNDNKPEYSFLYFEDLSYKHPYIPLVRTSDMYEEDLTLFYAELVKPDYTNKDKLVKDMQYLIPNLIDIVTYPSSTNKRNQLFFRLDNVKESVHIAMFGEGTNKLLRILLEIHKNAGKRLMIDEIGSGIHFSKLKLFWEVIINSAKRNHTQLFVTTHSQECLEYLNEAYTDSRVEEFKNDFRHIELVESNKYGVKANVYEFEDFTQLIKTETNLRG